MNSSEMLQYITCYPESDQLSYSVGGQGDQALSRTFVLFPGFGICIDLSGNKEKVITNPMQGNSDHKHVSQLASIAIGKENVAQCPGQHTYQYGLFKSIFSKEYGQKE